jgi:hypothetical protein
MRTAACSTSSLSAGTHSVVAVYGGDAGNATSSSAAVSQVISNTGTDVVWVDDALPAGATSASDGGDGWMWISSNPAPYSGSVAHQSTVAAGEHQHYFYNATATLSVAVGDTLFAYVYLDPANPPSEVILQWNDGTWEHRAYWGANLIGWGTDGTVSRRFVGALPATGQWVRLSVPAAQVGLEGRTLNGMAYTLYGGRATWDYAGKSTGGAAPSLVNPSFEIPGLGGGYQYNPTAPGIGWTFSANSGIQGNGSAWGAAPAPNGTQTAFIQGASIITQTVSLNAGSYTLSFQASSRWSVPEPIKVTVDGTQIGSLVSLASTSFTAVSIPFSVATTGAHTIAFTGTDPNDKTTFIDNVTVQ